MDAPFKKSTHLSGDLGTREAIIHELYLRLKAERETREAIIEAARSGASPEVLEAIATDPIPAIDEFGRDATIRALVRRFSRNSAGRSPKNLEIGR